MTDRIEKRDKHQPQALIKARPNSTTPDIKAFDKDRFDALLQGANGTPDAIPEQRPLAQSPLIPRFDAAPAAETQAGPQDEMGDATAPSLADAFEPRSQRDYPDGASEAVPASPQQEAQGQESSGILAGPGTQPTPAALDPRVLSARRKRKLQMEMKMQDDAAKTMAQEQAVIQQAQQLPPPSGAVPGSKMPRAQRVDAIGAACKAEMAPRTAPASPSPFPLPEIPEKDVISMASEHDEGTRQHRQHQSERQEIVAAEAGAAQVVQQQIIAQRNMPESLPLHLLESI